MAQNLSVRDVEKAARRIFGEAEVKEGTHGVNLEWWSGKIPCGISVDTVDTATDRRVLNSLLLLETVKKFPGALQDIKYLLKQERDRLSPEREFESGTNTSDSTLRTYAALGALIELLEMGPVL